MSSDTAARPSAGPAYRWPRPWIPAGPAVLVGAAAAGLVTAVSLPAAGPGLGWLVSASAVAASLIASRPGRVGAVRAGWAGVTGLLVGVGTVRAAGWLFALCLLAADRVLVRVLLGALTALTLVIVASALFRMHTYEQAYGFTRLRVLVSGCEAWLGSVLLLVLAAGVRLRGRWLPEAAVATAVAALLGLAAANPDAFIAGHNVTRYAETGEIDLPYLSGLSADAVPALDRLPGRLRDCALTGIAAQLADDDWRAGNLGRAEARDVLRHRPPGDCR